MHSALIQSDSPTIYLYPTYPKQSLTDSNCAITAQLALCLTATLIATKLH
jgi:hypothetical protein